jgi:hypothetical protein
MPVDGRKDREGGRGGSVEQANENGFGSIVGMMSRRDPGRASTLRGCLECLASLDSRARLDISARRALDEGSVEADPEGRRSPRREVELARRLRA